jgi:hypothetical protein
LINVCVRLRLGILAALPRLDKKQKIPCARLISFTANYLLHNLSKLASFNRPRHRQVANASDPQGSRAGAAWSPATGKRVRRCVPHCRKNDVTENLSLLR